MVVGMAATLVGAAAIGTLSWTVVLLPVIWLLNVVSLIGIVWFLSLLNVIFRDIQNILTPVLMMMLVISPIAYTPEIVPDSLQAAHPPQPIRVLRRRLPAGDHARDLSGAAPRARTRATCRGSVRRGQLVLLRAKRVIIDYV